MSQSLGGVVAPAVGHPEWHHCWQLQLAAVGTASATTLSRDTDAEILLTEDAPSSGAAPSGPVACGAASCAVSSSSSAWVQVQVGAHGDVRSQGRRFPPVLLLNTFGDVVPPVAGGGAMSVNLGPGGQVLALTPALARALGAELARVPRRLRAGEEPRDLLRRWMAVATRAGLPGAAAIVARFEPLPQQA